MPRISVYEDDPIRFCVDLSPDATAAAQRRVSQEELEELHILVLAQKRLQKLLAEFRERPEVEFEEAYEEQVSMGDTDPYADHVYCKVCRECVTCNLRPCRNGGQHEV